MARARLYSVPWSSTNHFLDLGSGAAATGLEATEHGQHLFSVPRESSGRPGPGARVGRRWLAAPIACPFRRTFAWSLAD